MRANLKGFQIIAVIFILAGFIGCEWLLARLTNGAGTHTQFLFQIIIRSFQALLWGGGLYFTFRKRDRFGSDLKNLALFSGSLLICLIILEVFLRLFTPASVFHPVLTLFPYQKHTIRRDLSGVCDTVYTSTNKWGLRGDPIPKNWNDLTSILTIGGSTTHCQYLSDNKTWPYRLQELLRRDDPSVMVQNGGLDGHTSYGHLLMMKAVVPVIKPKFIIVLAGVNDMNVAVRKISHAKGIGRQKLDNPLAQSRLVFRLYSYSRTLQFLFTWYQIIIEKTPIVNQVEYTYHRYFKPLPMDRKPTELDFLSNKELLTADYEVQIKEMIQIAKNSGIKMLFLTQPTIYEDNEYWSGIRADWFSYQKNPLVISAATEWKLLEAFNQKLLNICESEGIACFDLASEVPHSSDYFYDDYHFNELGAEFVAEKIYSQIQESGFLDQ